MAFTPRLPPSEAEVDDRAASLAGAAAALAFERTATHARLPRASAGRAILTGLLLAIPVAAAAWLYADAVLDPTRIEGLVRTFSRSLGAGELRGLVFAIGTFLTAALLAPRIARDDLGPLAAWAAWIVAAPLVTNVVAAVEALVRGGPGAGDLVTWILRAPVMVIGTAVLWVPVGGLWVAMLRRLTVAGVAARDDVERAATMDRIDGAARHHATVDATQYADQGSRNLRNRG